MKISEIPPLQPVLCKYKGAQWSDIIELTIVAVSGNGKAFYVRTISNQTGVTSVYHAWRGAKELDEKFDIFDTL